jgi:hypothetical protein
MSLLSLPDELIHQCSFHVIAHDPLGPPHALIPLALICRAFNLVVSSHAFRARICRLMFDVGAVSRRLFHPRDSDLADELHRCCNLLKDIRRGDVTESEDSFVDDTLASAYLLMLSNDGKNYAQLEHAGLDAYVNKFIMTRLWEGSETNQGWPLDNFINSIALWLMWMTLTKRWSFLSFLSFDYLPTYIRKTSGTVAGNSRRTEAVDLPLCRPSPPCTSTQIFI